MHDFLDDVRLRPSMYVRGRSVLHLQSILFRYSVACEIHGVPAMTHFVTPGRSASGCGLDSTCSTQARSAGLLRSSGQLKQQTSHLWTCSTSWTSSAWRHEGTQKATR